MPARNKKNKKKHHHQQQNNNSSQNNKQQQQSNKTSASSASTTPESHDEHEILQSGLPYKVAMSSIMGRYLVASRDLKPGEQLINEQPLAIGPCVSGDAVCLGCYMPVELKPTQYRCPSCQWPMCGEKCRGLHQSDGHNADECALLKAQNTAGTLNGPLPHSADFPVVVKNLYELILIVRILLMREHAPEKYATILRMESHIEMRKQDAELWQHYERNVVERLRCEWHMESYSSEEIHTICGILDVNCFEIGQNTAKARTLYASAFLLAHDCSPNTAHTDDPTTYAIMLRTSRRVLQGEAITLSYAYTLQGTYKRRDFMYAGKLFWCCCKRCADPKELGTDCSTIVCAKCSNGSLRSTAPLDQEAEWKCDHCDYKLTSKELVNLLDKIDNDMESIDVHDIPGLENFLKRYSKVLHPNHYLLLSAKYLLCQLYGRVDGYLLQNMSLEDIKTKERYCREFLEVIDVLDPGLTRVRGLIMYELHAPIMMISQRLMQSSLISKQDYQRNIKEVIKLLRECRDILKMEPPGCSEHQMGLAAEEALIKMGCN